MLTLKNVLLHFVFVRACVHARVHIICTYVYFWVHVFVCVCAMHVHMHAMAQIWRSEGNTGTKHWSSGILAMHLPTRSSCGRQHSLFPWAYNTILLEQTPPRYYGPLPHLVLKCTLLANSKLYNRSDFVFNFRLLIASMWLTKLFYCGALELAQCRLMAQYITLMIKCLPLSPH